MTRPFPARPSRMTIRVYRVSPDTGEQITVRPRREISFALPVSPPLPANPLAFPTCRCPNCAPGSA